MCTRRLQTVLLCHETRCGSHYDWLMVDPRSGCVPDAAVWAARVKWSSRSWGYLGSWLINPIAPHRRCYLTYQGPVTDNRGTVRRVDAGWFVPLLWTEHRLVVALAMQHFTGSLDIRRLFDGRWRGIVRSMDSVDR